MKGFRLAVKDNIDVAGLPTTAGLQAWRNRIAQQDAPVVSLLKARGAVVTGKTLMDEAAFGALGDNPWYGRVHSPARHGYTCGGSSAGLAVMPCAGHTINIEDPDEFNRQVFSFLSAVEIGAWPTRDPRSTSGGILGMGRK